MRLRWLRLAAASAAVGAALLGLSSLGPQVGVAAADTSGPSSASAESTSTKPAGESRRRSKSVDREDRQDRQDRPAAKARNSNVGKSEKPSAAAGSKRSRRDERDVERPMVPTEPWAVHAASPESERQNAVAAEITSWTASSQAAIASLPVVDPVKELLTGGVYFIRRTFLNQAPTMAPVVQFAGGPGTPIAGRVNAVDPEGDSLVYRLVTGPESGTVQLNADGTYVFTPGADFDGVETFTVTAYDLGLHVNLLDLSRAAGTSAGMLVNQGAIEFAFSYTSGSEHWTEQRRAALQSAAGDLAPYFLVTAPVTLTYDVSATNSLDSDILASAGSGRIGDATVFWRTLVQHKLLTGEDGNGAAADAVIDWNFAYPWALGATVGSEELDFTTVVRHELMHSFGFDTYTGPPGDNTGTRWLVFDSFLVNAAGIKAISSDFRWDPAFDANVEGGNGGLFFGGPNAVEAYGGLVPLYVGKPWDTSNVVHLDQVTFTGGNRQLMTPRLAYGPGVRVLSPIELGILEDLGYTVVSSPTGV